MTEQGPIKPEASQSFLHKALDQTPQFVMGAIGMFVGLAIAVIAVLKLGGLDAPVNRIVNAYAAGIEQSLTKLEKSSTDLEAVAAKFQAIQASLGEVARRVDRLDAVDAEQNRKLIDHESRITAAEQQIRRMRGLP